MNLKKKIQQRLLSLTLFSVMLCISNFVQAKVKLPSIFSDYMVFQQKTKAVVWGKADPGKTISISTTWSSARYTSKADELGNWKILVATPSYGGPYAMTISDGDPLILMNIMIGEVWVCSGQSNMEMPLAGWGKVNNYEQEIAAAKYPDIRLLQVDHVTSNSPLNDAKVANSGWKPCNSQYVAEFSSVAYFFAREIYNKTKVPIGLIHTSWGGTIAEAWTSGATLKTMPDFVEAVHKIENSEKDKSGSSLEQQLASWQQLVLAKDTGLVAGKPAWIANSLDVSSWKVMSLPTEWEQAGMPGFDGVVWFRKNITIPQAWEGKELTINLGTIDDNDITFFDGEKIGETEGYNKPRSYTIPANKVKAGTFALVVRIFDGSGGGGIYGNKDVISLVSEGGSRFSLDGEWQYKVGLNLKDIPPTPALSTGPNRTTVLYNAMIHPFLQFPIKGAIWYQGESNADRAHQYRTLFPAMITDWRKQWGIGDFPFYFVQLANFMKVDEKPVASAWAELRDAQRGALSLPNTGMAVSIDLGDAGDIHPKNKQDVGKRLALIALAKTYGIKVPYTGPVYQSAKIESGVVKLNFTAAEGLKTSDGAELKGFAIAGSDQKFHWAKAEIKGNQIVLSSKEVPEPVAVRYAWANNPVCNLVNGVGLPASPFRTDKWADSTK
ncbi:9-O-acetylesterase [Pedobacter steynii]|uniref:9-O-acetylesterase n=2 Tax=Pedobacter steynii TaxID=430522 RepID=A0A1D7QPN7_9SPHI|nr:9-O-acetylesterase [Pedobacter steynii]